MTETIRNEADHLSRLADGAAAHSTNREKIRDIIVSVPALTYPILAAEAGVVTLANARYPYGDVRRFGAVGDGTTDDSAAIQAAIELVRAAGGGVVYLPADLYAIGTTLTIGSAGVTAEGVILEASRLTVRTTGATLKWIGATGGDNAMIHIRNAHHGAIRGIGFDAANKADYCIQIRHVPGDVDVAQHWDYDQCTFMSARKYNVLIGEVDGTTSTGDEMVQNFHGCFFRSDSAGLANTTAHVRVRSGNTFGVNFFGGQFASAVTPAAALKPTYGLSMDSGTANFFGFASVGQDNTDIFMETAAPGGSVPPNVCVYGWESQSTNFMRATLTSSMQRSTILSGVRQNAILGTPGDAIQWNQNSGHGGLVLDGCRFNKAINIQSANSRVWSLGTIFSDSTQTFSGFPGVVDGSWGDNNGSFHQIPVGTSLAINQANSINRMQGAPITVLVDGVIPLGTSTMCGFLYITDSEGAMAIYIIRGTGGLTTELSDIFGIYDVTAGTASRTNIYWSAGNSRYELQNKRPSTRIYRLFFIGQG